tara:strand:- start:98 stop:394 length:297 start_codon:yes stop_codon:yes gene_type:complete
VKQFPDILEGYQLGLLFGLTPAQAKRAIQIYETIRLDAHWTNKRNNYALMVDCLYLLGKKYKTGITALKVVDITKQQRGYGTQPMPHKWQNQYKEMFE